MTLKHLMIHSRTAVTLCFLLTVACIQARIIKGKIIDRVSGEEIIGASVIVKGTANKGTATGLDGSFQLNQQHFPCTLVCSYLGYKTIEVEVNDNDNNLRINLETDDVALGEVVVVAENKGSSEIGARQLERNAMNVVNVMSAKAIELVNANVELNFPADERHDAVAEDAFKFLSEMKHPYDLIILDPPAFAKHKDALKNALRGYTKLNAKALEKIQPGGILFTFSCSQAVSKDQFRMAVFTAAALSHRRVRILHQLHQPADHPINIYHPEGEYLKGLVLYVE